MTEWNTPGMGTYGSTWQHAGYSGAGNVAGLLDSLRGRPAIVCGNAAGVFEELEEAKRLLFLARALTNNGAIGGTSEPVIVAANDVGMYLDVLDHWVTLHTDNLAAWKAVRWLHHRGAESTQYHAPDEKPPVNWVWSGLNPHFALSGYYATQIMWLMGCRPIVLCGCPGTPARRFFEAQPRADFGYGGGQATSDQNIRRQVEQEMKRLPEFKRAVRSMSGWTREFFGAPDVNTAGSLGGEGCHADVIAVP